MEVLRDMHLPQGFEFHPTDIELVSHYLKRKILGQKIEYDLIPEVDIYKHKPWDLPAKCNLPIKDNKWHFFASRDRKYPTGSRKNRETLAGYWKSTGNDRAIKMNKRTIGMKKTLVFHVGRPPSGTRTEWIMHEYYIDENECELSPDMKDAFVLCRVTKRNDWALDNDNEVGNRNPHLEQLDDAATSVVSIVKPEDSAASVICPEESNHATTPVSSAELSNELQIYCKMEILRDMHLPPGFVFNPSDPELISHYLKRKILGQKIEYDLIPEVDIYKHEPWDLPEKCNLPIKNNKWHFFAYRDRKYPTGSRSNRATIAGYWKPTGKDQAIKLNKRTLGTKKTLVFHEGWPPTGRRTEWIMHEYSIDENECKVSPDMKDAFVLCRVAKRNDWALDNDNEVGNRNPHLEQLDDAATSVVSTVKPEDSAASVICPEESNHATTPVGSAELSNDVGQAAITPYLTFLNGGNELDTWLEELLNPSPSFNLVADTGSADVSLTEQYAESSVTTLGSVSKLLSEVESMAVSVAPSWPQLITSGPMETSTKVRKSISRRLHILSKC